MDRAWHCYHRDDLSDMLGDYGAPLQGRAAPALLCLRASFGIDDPAKAVDLKATVTCLGGVVVCVNGQEVGRAYMPEGQLWPLTPANDYPIEAYTTDDGETPLPPMDGKGVQVNASWLPCYRKRLRKCAVTIPSKALVQGRNVLAISAMPCSTPPCIIAMR